jgi:hypothetical protein
MRAPRSVVDNRGDQGGGRAKGEACNGSDQRDDRDERRFDRVGGPKPRDQPTEHDADGRQAQTSRQT